MYVAYFLPFVFQIFKLLFDLIVRGVDSLVIFSHCIVKSNKMNQLYENKENRVGQEKW